MLNIVVLSATGTYHTLLWAISKNFILIIGMLNIVLLTVIHCFGQFHKTFFGVIYAPSGVTSVETGANATKLYTAASLEFL